MMIRVFSYDASWPTVAGLDFRDAKTVTQLLTQAAQANLRCALRKGATVDLPATGSLVIAGDLHDHVFNLRRILKLAALHESPHRYLILQEILHGPNRVNGCDLSIRTLAFVAWLKSRFPDQLHLLQSNHELAQRGNEGILKDSLNVVASFDQGLDFIYANQAGSVREALGIFIQSLPLAVRCPNGVFCCHSLPSSRAIKKFDPDVIGRVPTQADLAIGGHAHAMVWGRRHPQSLADTLAQAWEAKLFVLGHQPAEMGFELQGDTMLILASDHDHGVALRIDLSESYTRDGLPQWIVPLASIMV